jgi:hypothetical protein
MLDQSYIFLDSVELFPIECQTDITFRCYVHIDIGKLMVISDLVEQCDHR